MCSSAHSQGGPLVHIFASVKLIFRRYTINITVRQKLY